MNSAKLTALRAQDRKELQILLTAVNGAMNSLRRDECSDPAIIGSRGTIRACNGKFSVDLSSRSGQAWTNAKRALASFATVKQDGDEQTSDVELQHPVMFPAALSRDTDGIERRFPGPIAI